MFLFRKRHNSDRKEKSAGFQDLAVERKAGNIDAKSRIKLDTISKAEYNSIMKNICELKTDISGEKRDIELQSLGFLEIEVFTL